MSATPPTTPASPTSPLVLVEDLDTFVEMLTHWHENKVAILTHMMEVPECTEVEVDGKPFVLAGDMMDGYKLGIQLALMELGVLPFASEEVEPSVDAGF